MPILKLYLNPRAIFIDDGSFFDFLTLGGCKDGFSH